MRSSPAPLLAILATLATSVAGTPVAAADAAPVAPQAQASQIPVLLPTGAEPVVILGIPGKAPIPVYEEVSARDTIKITKRSYAGSCNTCSLNANYLQCKCRNAAQVEIWTSLDLNQCLANANGALVWRAGGGFYGSCGQSGWWYGLSGSVLQTVCATVAGNYVATSINLDERIHNYNGNLGCAI